jgi:hypothetical protein
MNEPRSGETSSSKHGLPHQYAANHDQFAGWLPTGGTAQSIGQPEIRTQAEKQAETSKTRTMQKATRKPRAQ